MELEVKKKRNQRFRINIKLGGVQYNRKKEKNKGERNL